MPVLVDDGTIYGLLYGVEQALLTALGDCWYDNDSFLKGAAVLSEIFDYPEKLAKFKASTILSAVGNRLGWIARMRSSSSRISPTRDVSSSWIDKMNSQHSPVECKRFDLGEFDK